MTRPEKCRIRAGLHRGLGALGGMMLLDAVEKVFDSWPRRCGDWDGYLEIEPGIQMWISFQGGGYSYGCSSHNEDEWRQLRERLLKLGWTPAEDG